MKTRKLLKKVIAILMAVTMAVGIAPIGNIVKAYDEKTNFTIQVFNKAVPAENVNCSISGVNENIADSGKTDIDGIWKTKYSLNELDDKEVKIKIGDWEKTITITKRVFLYDVDNSQAYEWSDDEAEAEKLEEVGSISDIVMDNGVSAENIKNVLPKTIKITTSKNNNRAADIQWENFEFNNDKTKDQKISIIGRVILPIGVANTENKSLNIKADVVVKKYPDANITIKGDAELSVGERLELSAIVKNGDSKNCYWYKGDVLKSTGESLIINQAALEDAGTYICRVKGENGQEIKKEIDVKVNKVKVQIQLNATPGSGQTRPLDKVKLEVSNLSDDATGTLKYTVQVKEDNGYRIVKESGMLNSAYKVNRNFEYTEFSNYPENNYLFEVEYSGDEKYEKSQATLKYDLKKGVQEKVKINLENEDALPDGITKGDDGVIIIDNAVDVKNIPRIVTTGGNGKGKYVFSFSDNNMKINDDGTGLILPSAGVFSVYVCKDADNDFNQSERSELKFKVGKKRQDNFAFETTNPGDIVYKNGLKFHNEVKAETIDSSNRKVVYSVSDNSVADINSKTGELTVKKAGTIEVSANNEGDGLYAPATSSYIITINKGKQRIKFANKDEIIRTYYGEKELKNEAYCVEENDAGVAAGERVNYSISESIGSDGDLSCVPDIDKSGRVTFKDDTSDMDREYIITATAPEDDRYKSATAAYRIKVIKNDVPEKAYEIEGKKNNNKWSNSELIIKPKEGYKISQDNSLDSIYQDEIKLSNNNYGSLDVYLKEDNTGHITKKIVIDASEIKIDRTAPQNSDIIINYSAPKSEIFWENITYGFYQKNVSMTVKAKDNLSGIYKIEWNYIREKDSSKKNVDKLSGVYVNANAIREKDDNSIINTFEEIDGVAEIQFTIPEENDSQIRGNISITVTDMAGNLTTLNGEKEVDGNKYDKNIIVDNIEPILEVGYSKPYQTTKSDNEGREITITEEPVNDASSLLNGLYKYSKSQDEQSEENKYNVYYENQATVTLVIDEANFDLIDKNDINVDINHSNEESKIEYDSNNWVKVLDDKWQNTVSLQVKEGTYDDFRINVSCEDKSGNKMVTYESPKIAIGDKTPEIKVAYDLNNTMVDETEYYNSDRKANITIDEHNFRAQDIDIQIESKDISGSNINAGFIDGLKEEIKNPDNWKCDKANADIHSFEICFDEDGIYQFRVRYISLTGKRAETYETNKFVIDKLAPSDITINYNVPKLSKLISNVTFGYYNPDVTVTIEARDNISGVKDIKWTYNKEENSSKKNVITESSTVMYNDRNAKFTYDEDGVVAKIEFTLTASEAKQYRGNISAFVEDKSGNNNSDVDNDNTVIVDNISPTRTIEFSKANQVVRADTLKNVDNYNYLTERNNCKLYYQNSATATIKIDEANFYQEDVNVSVKDLVANKITEQHIKWSKESGKDVWTAKLVLKNEGHYVINIKYADRSDNKMKDYESNEIIIDHRKPVVKVDYTSGKSMRILHKRKFYNSNQTAVIRIKEHNFRADDVEVKITAKDVAGNEIKIDNFTSYLKKRSSWNNDGDYHVAKIKLKRDANYTFDIDYHDLSGRGITKYKQNRFTIDKSKPKNLKVSYSSNILDTILQSVSFGFYNARMTVTIQADDEISGVNKFVYSYENADGVSRKNAEIINQALLSAKISYSNGGKTAVAKFNIPKNILAANSQFRGNVRFVAYDKSENNSEKKDKKTIVVDNIAPNGTVTLNKPVASVNGTDYYTGDIVATIKIDEANFYPEDVIAKVNGRQIKPEGWTQSGDNWTGRIVISGDGHYNLTVDYADKSKNRMNSYKSSNLTIDSRKPKITVSGIKNLSANKSKKIGFTITTKDENLNASSFKANLQATCRTSNGQFKIKNIKIEKEKIENNGKTYIYNVDNLEEDAIYNLRCEVSDYSGNSVNSFEISDSKQNNAKELLFSVNRKGSTFLIDESTKKVVDTYYVQNVGHDIKITEVNTDPLKSYKVELNKKELSEGTDYVVNKEIKKGQWCRYEYVVKSSLMKDEGEYSIIVTSVDKTKTTAYSDIKNAEVKFVIDRTEPVITVSGIEKSGRYQTNSQKVTVIPNDDGGKLDKLIIEVKDTDGKLLSTPYELEGDALTQQLEENNNKLVFDLGEGIYQNVDIVCIDKAGNKYVSKVMYHDVTVSSNAMVIFWANRMLRWGVILGLIILTGGIIIILVRWKKKKDDLNRK